MALWMWRAALALVLIAVLCATGATGSSVATGQSRPNIVFVLTDDLSGNLLTPLFMPNVWALTREGTSFSHYFVTDSLCCPSRASIFTGRYPHDTGVFSNSGPGGGYDAFMDHGDELSTLATDLQAAGYKTAMMGKYLNKYQTDDPPAPGWDVWDVAGWGYPEFNYTLNENGRRVLYGGPNDPRHDNYLTDVLSSLATSFISDTVQNDPQQPFFLEVATFAPHQPYTPAPKYAHLYPALQYPRKPSFDAPSTNPPAWLRGRGALTTPQLAEITQDFRLRAEDVKSVDDMVGAIVATLRLVGARNNTYIVFSSDNGYHMGEHRLAPGKLTAFDTDIRVPLVVAGPGVYPDYESPWFAQNIDLRSTFDAIAGTSPSEPVDGRSLMPLFSTATHPADPFSWPEGALVEHRGPVLDLSDPDYQSPASANPPSYEALRLPGALYVEYAMGGREFYDLNTDPYELDNTYPSLPAKRKTALHNELVKAENCHDAVECAAPFIGSTGA